MPTSNPKEVWVVNTITLKDASKAQSVADLQLELVDKVKRTWPGFVSQQTLVAQDGKTVTTVEAWVNFETLKAITADARLLAYRARIEELATLSPILYRRADR